MIDRRRRTMGGILVVALVGLAVLLAARARSERAPDLVPATGVRGSFPSTATEPPPPAANPRTPTVPPVVSRPREAEVAFDDLRARIVELAALSAGVRSRTVVPATYRGAWTELVERARLEGDRIAPLALTDPDPAVRTHALGLLIEAGGALAVQTLERALDREVDPALRLVCLEGLARLGGPEAGRVLLAEFRHRPDDPHRYRLADLLGQTGLAEAAGDLAAAVRGDLDPSVRLAALRSLVRLDPPGARRVAAAALTDSNPAVRRIAGSIVEEEDPSTGEPNR